MKTIKQLEALIEFDTDLLDEMVWWTDGDYSKEIVILQNAIKENTLQISILKGETTLGQLEALKDNQTISLL